MILLGLSSLISLIPTTFAIIGGDAVSAPDESRYPSVCKIETTNFLTDRSGTCTGTLLADGKIITAGHCFGRDFPMKNAEIDVTCGGKPMGRVKKVTVAAGNVSSHWIDAKNPVSKYDFALVALSEVPANDTATVTPSLGRYFKASGGLNAGVKCKILGYGKDDRGNLGTLHLVSTASANLAYESGEEILKLTPKSGSFLPISVDKGDSGGPVFCSVGARDPELVGTTVMKKLSDSLEGPIWNEFTNADFIRSQFDL